MTRWLETDSLSNQDISSALAIGAYTADADRMILVQFFADQVAGNGDYDFYVTLRVNGAGSSYRLIPITTAAAASGLTAIGGQSGMIAVRSGDVVTVYLDGLAGDNSTPDTTVRWFEMAALQPTTPGRTLTVNEDGQAGIDWANVGSPTNTVALTGTTINLVQDAIDNTSASAEFFESIASIINDTVSDPWNALLEDYVEVGSFGLTVAEIAAGAGIASAVRTELAVELAHLDADVSTAGGGLTAQETRDAMKLAPTVGSPAAGSVDAHLDAIQAQTDLIDDIKAVTDALDVTAVTQVAASNAGEIVIKRTLTLAAVVSGLTIPADWTACYWTVKRSVDDADADALAQVLVSNPGDADDGVQVLMGEALTDESDGSLVVNQAGGTVTIALGDTSTALLEDAVELVWDVKVHTLTGKTQPGSGTATITTAVTRA